MAIPVTEIINRTHSEQKSWPRSWQSYLALLVMAGAVTAIVLLGFSNREASLTAGFGFLFGYIMQRSRFCFAAAFRDIFMIRNTALSRAVLLLFILTSIGFALVQMAGGNTLPASGIIYPVGFHTVAGGLIFGFGMVIAGNCVSGCLMRMGEGYLMQWVTFTGILLGSAVGAWNLGWWGRVFIESSPVIYLPESLGWALTLILYVAAVALLYLLAIWYERGTLKNFMPGNREKLSPGAAISKAMRTAFSSNNWSYSLGAVGLALTGTLLFYFWGKPAAITGGLTHFVGWIGMKLGLAPLEWYYFEELLFLESRRVFLEHPLLYLSAAIIVGSLFASLLHREFRIRRPKSGKFIYSALIGGAMLGFSSRVAMGCNFGGLWGGFASFSLHSWVFGLFILVGAYFGGKFFLRYLL